MTELQRAKQALKGAKANLRRAERACDREATMDAVVDVQVAEHDLGVVLQESGCKS
jgi:hypothetical protein